jgi:uncharacterized protein (TIGR03086 family)
MMIDLKPACDRIIDLISGIANEQLSAPTPCTEYTVGDLIEHVDLVAQGATALARCSEFPDTGCSHLESDWQDTFVDHLHAVGEAWDDPKAWEGSGNVPGSDLSNATWGKITLTELVVHGWDIATAIGRPFDLPEQTLRACLDHVAVFVPNAPLPDLWGPPVEIPPDAALLVRILSVTGRAP